MTNFTHFNSNGDARMVDVGEKKASHRIAVASGRILMLPATLKLITSGGHKKGDVLGIARVAAIMAAKKTSDLVPLCHPLMLTRIDIDFRVDSDDTIICKAQVETRGQTGVEMEALTAVQVGLLTIYDMCKAVDRGMTMTDIGLDKKSGGKSGDWHKQSDQTST